MISPAHSFSVIEASHPAGMLRRTPTTPRRSFIARLLRPNPTNRKAS